MREKLGNLWNFAKQYPFTFIALCLSWFMSICMVLYSIAAIFGCNYDPTLENIWQYILAGIFSLIPAVIFSVIIFFWYKFLKDKNHIVQKILQGIILLVLNCIILCAQSVFCFEIMIGLAEYDEVAPYQNPKQYKYVVKYHSNDKEFVKIFPKTIPSDAKDVKTWGYVTSPISVYEEKDFVLWFSATPEYIDKEIKRLEQIALKKASDPEKDRMILNDPFYSVAMSSYIPSIISKGNYEHYPVLLKYERVDRHHSNQFTGGCFIDKSANKIIYYYTLLYGDYGS